jgi:hypothetical protein
MKFRSPTEEPIHVSLVTGHTALVTAEGVELEPMFHREAVAKGAIPATMSPEQALMLDAKSEAPQFDRAARIESTLKAMLDGDNEGDFNKDGKPDLRAVNAKLGFQASRSEVDAVWAEVSAAALSEGEDD